MEFPNDEELKALRKCYPAGTLIRLICCTQNHVRQKGFPFDILTEENKTALSKKRLVLMLKNYLYSSGSSI